MRTIEMCPCCDGEGGFWVANGPDDVEKEMCERCEGKGTIEVNDDEI